MRPVDAESLADLGRATYLRLTTYRRDGTPVSTPVWPVLDRAELGGRDGEVLVTTGGESGKVKRLRHTSRVSLAPCNARGDVKRGAVEVAAEAEVLDDHASYRRARRLLLARHPVLARVIGLQRRLHSLVQSLRHQPPVTEVTLRIHRPTT